MDRIVFLIDGFNLYHSVREACNYFDDKSLRWLNISSLCSNYLDLISRDREVEDIYYFSALAHHKGRSVVARHNKFLKAIKDTGIKVELSRFKNKTMECKKCHTQFVTHEEKETDVALAVKMLELCFKNQCDIVVVMSGDTDMAPAARTIRRLCPDKRVVFLFPYKRKNRELQHLVGTGNYFAIKKEQYKRHKFPDEIVLNNGGKITKPIEWS